MEGILSSSEKQNIVSSFLEIAFGQTAETAAHFLQATDWNLDEAIQLFFVSNESGVIAPAASESPAVGNLNSWAEQNSGDNFGEEIRRQGVWDSDASSSSTVRDNLATLYGPPVHLMFHGSFEKAKAAASAENKWLLVNLQSNREFSSHMLNRDTWGNEAVSQTVGTNFVFWQVNDDSSEGSKVCTYYRLDSMPVVLVIDPITGQKMRSWCGMVEPEMLLEEMVEFMDGSPRDFHATLSRRRLRGQQKIKVLTDIETNEAQEMPREVAASNKENVKDSTKKPTFPPLPEEPNGDRNLLCRVGVRLPDGRRVQRSFLRSDPIQLLWSFCNSQLGEAESSKPFRLTQPIPGASKALDYNSKSTFEESGLANSMILVAWE